MNDYMIQTLNDCDNATATLKDVYEIYDDGCAFCSLWFENDCLEFPLNIDLYKFAQSNKTAGEKLQFKLAFYYSYGGQLHQDAERYKASQKDNSKALKLASECILPCGQFVKEGHQQDNTVLIHGKIVSVRKAVYDGIESLHIKLACQGFIFDVFIDDGVEPFPQAGNIFCAVFDVIGLVSD